MGNSRQMLERSFWDSFAKKYDPFMKNSHMLYTRIMERIEQEVEPDFIALDLAAGTGLLALELAKKTRKVYGVDISPNMVKIAKEKASRQNAGNTEFLVGDAYQLPFEEKMFDAVLICNALHVMLQPERVLLEVYRVLKKDGLLIVPTFCHGESRISRFFSFLMSLFGFKAFHKWSIDSFKSFIENNHYKVIRSEKIKDMIPLSYLVAKKELSEKNTA